MSVSRKILFIFVLANPYAMLMSLRGVSMKKLKKLKNKNGGRARILIGQFIKYFSLRTVDVLRVRCVFYCSRMASHVLVNEEL